MNYCTIDLLNMVILTKRFIGCFFFFVCLVFFSFSSQKRKHFIIFNPSIETKNFIRKKEKEEKKKTEKKNNKLKITCSMYVCMYVGILLFFFSLSLFTINNEHTYG